MRTFACIVLAAGAVTLAGCDSIVNSLLVESHSVTEGSFNGLYIGASKTDVLGQIKTLQVNSVSPIPIIDFRITKANLNEIDKVLLVNGIRITNHRGLAVDVFYEKGIISLVRRSVPAKSNVWFHEGQKIDILLEELRSILIEDPDLEVFPIIFYVGSGWVSITDPLPEVLKNLNQHDAWTFLSASDKPSGSTYEIYFKDNHLIRIEYRRQRIRLD